MSFGFPILLGAGTLTQSQRWRLVDDIFGRRRGAIEGGCAIAAASLLCYILAGGWIFVATLVASLVLLAVRLVHARYYLRMSASGVARRHTPDYWALQHSAGGIAAASFWAVLDIAVFHSGEPRLPFLILAVQSGWLGGSGPRTAALPAAALWQALVVLGPEMLYASTLPDNFVRMLVPFGLLQLLATVAIVRSVGAQIIAIFQSEQRLEAANARLTELSSTDGLTGIANRRAFDAIFQTEWARAAREGTDLAVLMIDVDNFKAYNDHYGHPAGDDCLRLVAELASATLRRPPDTAARFGGEEFIALLPGTDGRAAGEVAERVRLAIMETGMAHAGSSFGRVTVSIGSASLAPHPGQDRQALIDLADRALYEAKQAGRNTVRCAGRGLRIGAWRSPVGSDGAY